MSNALIRNREERIPFHNVFTDNINEKEKMIFQDVDPDAVDKEEYYDSDRPHLKLNEIIDNIFKAHELANDLPDFYDNIITAFDNLKVYGGD